jgi:hypothetical protein
VAEEVFAKKLTTQPRPADLTAHIRAQRRKVKISTSCCACLNNSGQPPAARWIFAQPNDRIAFCVFTAILSLLIKYEKDRKSSDGSSAEKPH